MSEKKSSGWLGSILLMSVILMTFLGTCGTYGLPVVAIVYLVRLLIGVGTTTWSVLGFILLGTVFSFVSILVGIGMVAVAGGS